MNVYRHVEGALVNMRALVQAVMRAAAAGVDLEVRLGTAGWTSTGCTFGAGVDGAFAAMVLARLEECSAWKPVHDGWQQIRDFYYTTRVGARDAAALVGVVPAERSEGPPPSVSINVRTSAHVVSSTAPLVTTHSSKSRMHAVLLEWEGVTPPHIAGSEHGAVYDVEVSMACDTPVPQRLLQDRVDAFTLVRLRQRRSFLYTPSGGGSVKAAAAAKPRWRVDVTQAWSGSTYAAASAALAAGVTPAYEVQLQCLQTAEYVRSFGVDGAAHVALACLLKIADFFEPREGMPRLATTDARLLPLSVARRQQACE